MRKETQVFVLTARVAFEPTSYIASTGVDPLNRHTVHATLAELRPKSKASRICVFHAVPKIASGDISLSSRSVNVSSAFEPTSYIASTGVDPLNRHTVHATLAELRAVGSDSAPRSQFLRADICRYPSHPGTVPALGL
jgi:NifB/MoaA-like Fe-S oxidoreductase